MQGLRGEVCASRECRHRRHQLAGIHRLRQVNLEPAPQRFRTIFRPGKRGQRKRITAKDIPNIYPIGSDVIVQVTKGPIGTKGPRVTTNLSFAGRYLVLMPFSERSGRVRRCS